MSSQQKKTRWLQVKKMIYKKNVWIGQESNEFYIPGEEDSKIQIYIENILPCIMWRWIEKSKKFYIDYIESLIPYQKKSRLILEKKS